jgi:hypothetical protein
MRQTEQLMSVIVSLKKDKTRMLFDSKHKASIIEQKHKSEMLRKQSKVE